MVEIEDKSLIYLINSEEVIQFKEKHYRITLKYSKEKQTLFYDLTNTIKNNTQHFNIEDFLLGGVILNNNGTRLEFIWTIFDYWYHENNNSKHRTVMDHIRELTHNTSTFDVLTLKESLANKKQLTSVGGTQYIDSLIDGVNKNSNFDFLVLLLENYNKTELYDFNSDFINIALPAIDQIDYNEKL